MNRRTLLLRLLALPFVPALPKLVEKIATSPAPRLGWTQLRAPIVVHYPRHFPDINALIATTIATTIESRSKTIADNISQNNMLLQMLRMTPEERADYYAPNTVCRRNVERRRRFPKQSFFPFDNGISA